MSPIFDQNLIFGVFDIIKQHETLNYNKSGLKFKQIWTYSIYMHEYVV